LEFFGIIRESAFFVDFVATMGVLTWFLEVEDHPDVLLLKLFYDVEFLIEAS
jgi:hypothetical protein